MKNAITSILTSTDVRDNVAVEQVLIQQVGVASPWAD